MKNQVEWRIHVRDDLLVMTSTSLHGDGIEGDDDSNQTEYIRVTIGQTMDGQYPSKKTALKP